MAWGLQILGFKVGYRVFSVAARVEVGIAHGDLVHVREQRA